jgi:hypothetical protein
MAVLLLVLGSCEADADALFSAPREEGCAFFLQSVFHVLERVV